MAASHHAGKLSSRLVLPLLLGAGLLLAGCGGKMPRLGFGGGNDKPPPLADLVQPAPTTAWDICAMCLLDPAGKRVDTSTALRGSFDSVAREGDKVVLNGWAADTVAKTAAVEVVFLAPGKIMARSRMTVARPDVAQALQFSVPGNFFGFRIVVDAVQVVEPNAVYMIDKDGKALKLEPPRR